jgi:glycosyltransferase involved in cell wall biosynthesis
LIIMNKVCYYLSNIVHNPAVIAERNAQYSGASCLRALFLARTFQMPVKIVSMGYGDKAGYFPDGREEVEANISIVYLRTWNLILFKKNFRHIFYAFFLLRYLLRNVKCNDLVLIYNTQHSLFMIVPVLIVMCFRKFCYVLELEEFYFNRRQRNRLSLGEWLSVKNAAGYVLVSEGQLPMVDPKKPRILNGGYRSMPLGAPPVKNRSSQSDTIIYTGRLDHEGGIEVFLEALRHVEKKCKVIITGSGPLEAIVKDYQNDNNNVIINYAGFIPKDEYVDLLLNAHIGVNPIRSQESFSNVSFPSKIIQYLEYGNKIISSDIAALNNLGPLRKYIYTYKDDSPVKMAKVIDELLNQQINKDEIAAETQKYFIQEERQLREFFGQFQ